LIHSGFSRVSVHIAVADSAGHLNYVICCCIPRVLTLHGFLQVR
jgi:hypothetical protein